MIRKTISSKDRPFVARKKFGSTREKATNTKSLRTKYRFLMWNCIFAPNTRARHCVWLCTKNDSIKGNKIWKMTCLVIADRMIINRFSCEIYKYICELWIVFATRFCLLYLFNTLWLHFHIRIFYIDKSVCGSNIIILFFVLYFQFVYLFALRFHHKHI